MRWAAVPLLLLLAGCASPAPTPVLLEAPADEPAPAPTTLAWRLLDCEAMTWSIPLLATQLTPHLPEGFEPAPAGTELPTGADQAASLGFEAVECTAGLGVGETVLRSVQFGRLFTPVIPPADARDGRLGTQHTYDFAVLAAPDAWRRAALDFGLPMRDGGALVGASAQGWTGALAMDNVGTFTLTGRLADDESPAADAAVRHFTSSPEGMHAWVGTAALRQAGSGVGVWQATPGSWVAEVVGSTQGVATFELGRYTLADGVVAPLWGSGAPGPTSPVDERT